MSSRLKSTLRHFGLALLGVVVSFSLNAAVETAQLKQSGNVLQVLGRKSCTSPDNVDIVLGPETLKTGLNDFRATFKTLKKDVDTTKSKGDSHCEATLAAGATNAKDFTKAAAHLSAREFISDAACQKEGISEKRVICIYEGGGSTALVAYAIYRVETAVAKIESIGERTAINGEVIFDVKLSSAMSGDYKIETCYGKTSDGDIDSDKKSCPSPFKIHESSSESVKITGLEDNVQYSFKVRLHERKEDPSEFEPSFKETPIPAANPFSYYQGRGGDIQFTCQQTGPSSLIILALTLAALALLRARKKWLTATTHLAILVFSLSFLAPETGHAEFGQMNIGLLGAMYRPDLDSETLQNGEKIFPFYKCFYRKKTSDKNGPINPLIGGEVDWHLWDGIGSLQLGLGFGYTFVTGHAVKLDSSGQPDCDSPIEKAKSTLHMYQVRPQLTYAFDYFADTFPFVPYIRVALIGHGYMFRRGDKAAPTVQNQGMLVKPNGFRFGYQAGLGMMLRLDFLEPGSIRSAHGQGFLEHVYLKGELSVTKIDGFGRRGIQFSAKDVMGSTWPLMWTFGLVFELP